MATNEKHRARAAGSTQNGGDSSSPTPSDDFLADVVPFTELPRCYPTLFPNKNTASWLLRQRDANGLAQIIHFVGRTAFVSKFEFATWFRAQPCRKGTTRI